MFSVADTRTNKTATNKQQSKALASVNGPVLLPPRSDLPTPLKDQKDRCQYDAKMRLHELTMKDYQSTTATIADHRHILKCLLNEGHRFQQTRVRQHQRHVKMLQSSVEKCVASDQVALVLPPDVSPAHFTKKVAASLRATGLSSAPEFRTEQFKVCAYEIINRHFEDESSTARQGQVVYRDDYSTALVKARELKLFSTFPTQMKNI